MIAFSFLLLLVFCNTDKPDFSALEEKVHQIQTDVKDVRTSLKAETQKMQGQFQAETKKVTTQIQALASQVQNIDIPTIPSDLVNEKQLKTSLEESFSHVQSLLDAIQMPDVTQFLKTEDFSVGEKRLETNIGSLQTEIDGLKKQILTQTESGDGNAKTIAQITKDVSKLQKDIKKLKSSQKRIETENNKQTAKQTKRLDKLEKTQQEQEKVIKDIRAAQQEAITTQFTKLKQDLKEELKKDVHGVFTSMAIEIGYVLALVRDSYTHVTYDIATRLGFKKKDVDSVFETISTFFSTLWKSIQGLFTLVKEKLFVFLALAKEKLPVALEFIRENTGEIGAMISEYSVIAMKKISGIASVVWATVQFYGEKGMSIAKTQFQELQKYDVEELKKAGANAMNGVKDQYEVLKNRPEVSGFLQTISRQVQELLPKKTEAEIDGYVDMGFLSICALVVFFSLYMLLQLFCAVCCRKRLKPKTLVEEKTEVKAKLKESPKKTESKKTSTPKKHKKGKSRR